MAFSKLRCLGWGGDRLENMAPCWEKGIRVFGEWQTSHLLNYFLAEEDVIFSKSELHKKYRFPENLRYARTEFLGTRTEAVVMRSPLGSLLSQLFRPLRYIGKLVGAAWCIWSVKATLDLC